MTPSLIAIALAAAVEVASPAPSADAAHGPASASSSSRSVPSREDPPGYRIGAEDVLQVSVWNNEAMSRTAPVRPDGKISLPLLNDVQAAGLTPMELRDQLIQRLAEYMPHPEVSVIVTDVRSFKVSVIGQVPKPDRYELKSPATVIDVLAMAGGFTEYASRSRIVIIRSPGGRAERIPFDYEKVRAGDPRQANFRLQPGDIVLVP
jgi:polysaccharide export outer membrane protein